MNTLKRCCTRALFCALLATIPSLAVVAEDVSAPNPSKIAPIPVGEIPGRAEAVRALSSEIQVRAKPDPRIEVVRNSLPELDREIRDRASKDVEFLEAQPTARDIETMERDWAHYTSRVREAHRVISDRSTELARDVEKLSESRLVWQATHERAAKAKISGVLRQRIEETQRLIDSTRFLVDQRMTPLVPLLDELAQLDGIVVASRQQVDRERKRLREQLFVRDSAPLWSIEFEQGFPHVERTKTQINEQIAATFDFFAARPGQLTVYALGSALLIALLSALAPRAQRRAQDDERFVPAARILARPFASSALVSLVTGVLILFPNAPDLVAGCVGLVLLIPIVRLLPHAIVPNLAWALYGTAVWYVSTFARLLVLTDPAVSRLVLLLEGFAVLALLILLLRPARMERIQQPTRVLRTIGFAIRLSIPLLAIALLANVLGNVSLAEMLTRALLASIYLAFLLFATQHVLEATYGIALGTRSARTLRMVRSHGDLILARMNFVTHMLLVLLWLSFMSESFRVRVPILDGLRATFTTSLPVGDIDLSLGDFALFGFMIWFSWILSRLIRFVLEEDVLPRADLPRGVPFAISTFARYTILVLGFMMAVAAAGFDLSRFALLVGALGVGIGIGLQDVVNNFVSGLILLFERPIQLGDTVEVNGVRGDVTVIGMRSSTVRTFDGAEVIIPNSQFISSEFVNWTLSDRQRRITLPVGVAYGSDPEETIRVMTEATCATEDILAYPEVRVIFSGFGESSLDFEVRAWTNRFESWRQVQSALGINICHALRDAGIGIPFPQRDLHLRSVSPEARAKSSALDAGREESEVE